MGTSSMAESVPQPAPSSPDGMTVKLTPTEKRLLELLISRPRHTFSRRELTAQIMADAIVLERTIDVHVKSLRKKMGPLAIAIQTVRGVGYRFEPTTFPS
jgi:two-component system phosphate regulon response regulator PhoB